MINKIIATLILSVSVAATANARVSQKELEEIATKLSDKTGVSFELRIDTSEDVNAWAECGNVITVTKGALDTFKYDEVAFLLGHEIGHLGLGHVGSPYLNCTNANYVWKKSEADADLYSMDAMKESGFDACRGGSGTFLLFLREYGDNGGPDDPHPSNTYRLEQVKEYACK